MLDIHRPPPTADTKTLFKHSCLPTYIDATHPPAKKSPFATFTTQPYSHTLDLTLPAELWSLIHERISGSTSSRVYARAWLKLGDILCEPFLDAYMRTGSVTMLSSGRDVSMDIHAGVLRIEMDRHVYERAGLVGQPVEDGGRKHRKSRWRVDVDLARARAGKKGFERVRWAAREVLNESRVWVFWSARPGFAEDVREGREVLCQHAPKIMDFEPEVTTMERVVVPRLGVEENGLSGLYDQDDALGLLEWLDLVNLGSARVRENDHVDAHLCRYDVPDFGYGRETKDLVRVRWTGFITPGFVTDLFLEIWKAGFKGKRHAKRGKGGDGKEQASDAKEQGSAAKDGQDEDITMHNTPDEDDPGRWFSMSAQAFGGKEAWSLMQFTSRETLVWEVDG